MPSDAVPRGAGVLVAIGGAEDKLGDRTILSHFVRLAGGTFRGGPCSGGPPRSSWGWRTPTTTTTFALAGERQGRNLGDGGRVLDRGW